MDKRAGWDNQSATATLSNCTISGNTAGSGGDGGGMLNLASSAGASKLTVVNCTITGNTALRGSGIVTSGSVNQGETVILNTLVAGNSGPNFFKSGANATLTDRGNNLDSDGTSGLANGVNGNKVGTSGSPLNALLAPLGNYGGPTQTIALLPGSPAIDAANNCVTYRGPLRRRKYSATHNRPARPRASGRHLCGYWSVRIARLHDHSHQRHAAKRCVQQCPLERHCWLRSRALLESR
jgi:hypothetical protein